MSDIDIDALIGEVAKKHGVRLGKDDPIFVALTLNKAVLERYVSGIDKRLEESARLTAEEHVRAREAAKDIAERIINEGAAFIAKEIEQAAAVVKNNAGRGVSDDGDGGKKEGSRDGLLLLLTCLNTVMIAALAVAVMTG